MGALDAHAARVAGGLVVEFRPTGSSMIPLIRSRQLVTVAPVDPARVEVGDIVLAKVAGTTYLHLVSAVNTAAGRVQISNNRGRVNGWTTHARVYGICTAVDGVPRPHTAGKTRAPDTDVPPAVRAAITAEVAREIATAYTDQIVFPDRVQIDRPEAGRRRFPGWAGPVLVISVENQGVCAWGVPLDGDDPAVLVGGTIAARTGPARGTTRYCSDVDAFVAARRWDAACLSQGTLLQAQAAELDTATLGELRQRYEEEPPTTGWPSRTVHRFRGPDVRILLCDSPGRCDWWISITDHSAVAPLPALSNLRDSLWSDDPAGEDLLRRVR